MRPGVAYDLVSVQTYEAALWADKGWTFGGWQFRPPTGEVLKDGKLVTTLTETEAETLNVLIKAAPLPLPRRTVVEEMRRMNCYWHADTVKTVVSRLRAKLGQRVIVTESRGYRFNPEAWLL